MGYRRKWFIRADQATILEWFQYYWWGRGKQIEIIDGPQDGSVWMDYLRTKEAASSSATALRDYLLVYPTHLSGWTIVWPYRADPSDEICRQMTWDLQAPLLEADYDSISEQRHWAWFDAGHEQAERWEFSEGDFSDDKIVTYQRDDVYPIQATLSFHDVFARHGLSFTMEHPLKGCKRVLLEKDTSKP